MAINQLVNFLYNEKHQKLHVHAYCGENGVIDIGTDTVYKNSYEYEEELIM